MRCITLKLLPLFLAGACGGNTIQSTWHPMTAAARGMKEITLFLIVMSALAFLVTLLLLLVALLRKGPKDGGPGNRFILISGLLIPAVILTFTLVYSLRSTLGIKGEHSGSPPLTVRVTGHQFWWEVEYPEHGILTANELHLPEQTVIRFVLVSKDVIHSFWIPNLHGKLDMLPDHPTELVLKTEGPGSFRGQCAEFCGLQHARMAFPLRILRKAEFAAWIKERKEPHAQSERLRRGRAVYAREACHTCHRVRDTEFSGTSGPDLTHLASRSTLGAGTISNDRENLRAWIRDSQRIKPHNRMPAYRELAGEDMDHLLDYLESLR